jgi:hypothetical protein
MELTLARRVGAALAAAGLAFSVLAGVTGVGGLAARSTVADTPTDAGLITEVGFPKLVGDGAAALPAAVDVLAEPAETTAHDHGPENFQTK